MSKNKFYCLIGNRWRTYDSLLPPLEASAYVYHTDRECEIFGHTGWIWWATGQQGDAPTGEAAKAAAEAALAKRRILNGEISLDARGKQ